MVKAYYRQDGYRVRFDWGPEGADAVGPGAAFVAVVDVLSFTTTLTVAVERGIQVLPYRWRDESAIAVARQHGAVLAVGRSEAGPGEVSLSPETVQRARGIERLVLPSPNGSTVAARVAAGGAAVVGVSLRNAAAAAAWVRSRAGEGTGDGVVAVIAAGERWNDGPLRPAAEDLWGAGAFIAALINDHPQAAGPGSGDALPAAERSRLSQTAATGGLSLEAPAVAGFSPGEAAAAGLLPGGGAAAGLLPRGGAAAGLSPEARAALAAWLDIAPSLPGALADCASGRELIGNGYPGDVAVAGERTDSTAVPVLVDGWFVDATQAGRGEPARARLPAAADVRDRS